MSEREELIRLLARAGVDEETAVYLPQILKNDNKNISKMLKMVKAEKKIPTDEQWYLIKAMEILEIHVPQVD